MQRTEKQSRQIGNQNIFRIFTAEKTFYHDPENHPMRNRPMRRCHVSISPDSR